MVMLMCASVTTVCSSRLKTLLDSDTVTTTVYIPVGRAYAVVHDATGI